MISEFHYEISIATLEDICLMEVIEIDVAVSEFPELPEEGHIHAAAPLSLDLLG